MNYAGYVAWILLCKHCEFDEKIYYKSRDMDFFLGDNYFLARPVYLSLELLLFLNAHQLFFE